jgi:hypothetical protein
MNSRLILLPLTFYLALALVGCSKPSTDSATDNSNATDSTKPSDSQGTAAKDSKESKERKEAKHEAKEEKKKEPLVVPAGTSVTISLGSAIGSKMSQAGQTFNGTVSQDVLVGGAVAVPKGANVTGTVTEAKALGKFAGGAVLQVRLDSITLNGSDVPVQTALKTFGAKGKGKRTAVATGGGAALGGIIGALAGGGKGAAIGMAAGAGAGAGGSALTGNKDVVLGAESAVTFELSQPLEIKRQ